MRAPRSVRDADVAGKHVLVRADLNVPLDDGRVADDTRIRASLPTLRLLLEREATEVVVCSHLGRPKGPDPRLEMEPVRRRLGELLDDVERPFALVSGGVKVEDKLGVLASLGGRADTVLVGGKMAEQLREENPLGFPVELPRDVVAAAAFEPDAEARVTPYDALPDGWLGLDIGPETRRAFAGHIPGARTIFWNGPMGVFEWPRFAEGTKAVAEAVAPADPVSVVGGADSIRALNELG